MPDTLKPVTIPDRVFTSWAERVLGLGVVMVLVGVGVLFVNQRSIKREQEAGEQRGYANRAASCRVLVALGVDIPREDPCRLPAVLDLYDIHAEPTAGINSTGQQVNRDLLCAILGAQGLSDSNCEGP